MIIKLTIFVQNLKKTMYNSTLNNLAKVFNRKEQEVTIQVVSITCPRFIGMTTKKSSIYT